MRSKISSLALLVPFLLLAQGCADGAAEPGTAAVKGDEGTALDTAKGDQWTAQDNPSLFSSDLEYRVAELPQTGTAAKIPWAGNYWPVYQDSLNHPWAGPGTESPAAKYGRAFGVADIEDRVSKSNGVDKWSTRTACTSSDDCESAKGETCAKRVGAEGGFCIPTWWGICHAWAPAAILEAEPIDPVTVNGVEFKVNDIKALLTLSYDKSDAKVLSLRCNEDEQSDGIEYDEYGNPSADDAACKDTNAGTFHVVVTNFLGIKGEAFVEDRTFDDEVWNQPVSAYRVTQLEEVDAKTANVLAGVTESHGGDTHTEKKDGEVAKGAWFDGGSFDLPAEAIAKVRMSVSEGDPDLYVRVGSEPTSSDYDCRPYTGGRTTEECSIERTTAASQLFVKVNGYEDSKFTLTVTITVGGEGVPETYVFNADAKTFFHVKMELDYISESPADRDGNLASTIAQYTHTDRYEYVLEVDAEGKVNGGEWIGDSKRSHPDFLWLPTNRRSFQIAGGAISYSVVKSLLEQSLGGGGEGELSLQTVSESGHVDRKAWRHFGPFEVAAGDLEVSLTGSGDADLYVRRDAQPTSSQYDCRPYLNGSDESCVVAGPGTFYVSLHGYAASDFELGVTFQAAVAGDSADDDAAPVVPPTPEVVTVHVDEAGQLAHNELKVFTLQVRAGQTVVSRTTAAHDIDVYLRMGEAPTTGTWDARGYTDSGAETVSLTAPQDGTMYVAVHGYEASDFTLKTADQ